MIIDGNIRSSLILAISAVRTWLGRPVHRDTVNYWQGVLEQGRRVSTVSFGEPTADLVAELEQELAMASRAKHPSLMQLH